MNRRAQVLFAAGAIPVAAAIGIVAAVTPLPPWVLGAAFLALTVALFVWHRLALGAYRGDGVVIFSRGPWPVIAGLIVIEALCALYTATTPDADGRIWFALGYSLAVLVYLGFVPSMLLFWVADDAALTSQILAVRRSLPWPAIDWLYLESSETTHKQLQFVTIARWKDEQLDVEAGPQHSMQVLVRTPLAGGSASPLLQAIRARATNAAFGLDQLPRVQARRRGQAPALSSPQPEPSLTLPEAVELARTAAMPATWTRFPVRQSVIWPNIIVFAILGVVAIGCGVFIVATNTVIGLDVIPQSWLDGPLRTPVLIGEGLLFLLIALYLFFVSRRWLRTLRRPQDYFFLVTPRYVAEVQGKKVEGVAISNVLDVHRSGGGFYGWQIVLDMRSGKKREFDVGGNYGPSRDLYAYVLAAMNARRPVQVGAPTPFGAPSPFGAGMQSDSEM